VLDVRKKTHHAFAGFEAGENSFVDRDDRQAREGNAHRVMVKHRNAKQSQAE
jgi:hypothetical protein